ncbi:magnesium transporter MgtE N-terminal domain-containing protein [Nisaea denitrificans]|uniref:magnesium transporter MgtE N-terminal domain-containing protein n=1 Tax=Nisaea denitrificans TaxID=390877 RepID=UPI0004016B9A|nr:magnesium transporter [Nisaea denitrificans]
MTDYQSLAADFLRQHPAEAASILEKSDSEQIAAFAKTLDEDEATRLLMALSSQTAAASLRHFGEKDTIAMLGNMPRREASNILRRTPRKRREAYLASMPAATRLQLEVVLHQPTHRVGAYTDSGLVAVTPNTTVEAIRKRLRSVESPVSVIFLVNDKQQLLGSFPIGRLFSVKGSETASSLADTTRQSLNVRTTLEDGLASPDWMNNDVLGVVDREGKLVGSVRYAILRQANEPVAAPEAVEAGSDYMRVADNLYVGLAEVLLTTIPKPKPHAARNTIEGDAK